MQADPGSVDPLPTKCDRGLRKNRARLWKRLYSHRVMREIPIIWMRVHVMIRFKLKNIMAAINTLSHT